jgi:hypothetical protein
VRDDLGAVVKGGFGDAWTRTDAEEEEGEERDGVAAEAPAQAARGGRLLCGLHVGGRRVWELEGKLG